MTVTDRGCEISDFAHTRATSPVNGERHLFGDGGNLISNHFNENRIEWSVHRASVAQRVFHLIQPCCAYHLTFRDSRFGVLILLTRKLFYIAVTSLMTTALCPAR